MTEFNKNSFIGCIQKEYEAIPYIQGDKAAKVMVANAIKSSNFNPADALAYLCNQMSVSRTPSKEEWKDIFRRAANRGDLISKNIKKYARAMKGKLSNEEFFSLVADCCGKNPEELLMELSFNQIGWKKTIDHILSTAEKSTEEKVEETTAVTADAPAVKSEKKSTKSSKKDPRCQSVIGAKDGVTRVWNSMKECEVELGVGHGTVSQCISGKLRTVKGWTLSKKGEEPVKKASRSFKKPVRQYGKDKGGNMVDKVWPSLTEASKGTGISHSSISKVINGDYHSAGGYHWENVDMSVAAA